MLRTIAIVLALCAAGSCGVSLVEGAGFSQGRGNGAPPNFPAPKEGDYIVKNYKFTTGEALPEVRLHYTTVGTPVKDSAGVVRNAVIVMHGTGGSGRGFTSATFGGILFKPGGLLDGATHYIIMPDAIGHGASSKPSACTRSSPSTRMRTWCASSTSWSPKGSA